MRGVPPGLPAAAASLGGGAAAERMAPFLLLPGWSAGGGDPRAGTELLCALADEVRTGEQGVG